MLNILQSKPSAKINRIILMAGLLIFVPCYTYILQLFGKLGIETAEFNSVWLSFDHARFMAFFQKLDQAGSLLAFRWSFALNILSLLGFMLLFFAVSLMIARRIPSDSRLSSSAFLFPVLPIIVGAMDIFPSLLLLSVGEDLFKMAGWQTWTISACYVFRVLVLYGLIIWMIVVGISLAYGKLRKGKAA